MKKNMIKYDESSKKKIFFQKRILKKLDWVIIWIDYLKN